MKNSGKIDVRFIILFSVLILSSVIAVRQIYAFGLNATFPPDNYNCVMWQNAPPLVFNYVITADQPGGSPEINCSFYSNFTGLYYLTAIGGYGGGPIFSEIIAGNYANPPGIISSLFPNTTGNYMWSIQCYNTSDISIRNVTANRTFTLSIDMGMNTNFNFGGESFSFSPGPPTPLGSDNDVDAVNEYVDLKGLALKELPGFMMLAVMVRGDRVGSAWGADGPDENQINFSILPIYFNATHKAPYCTQNASSPGDAQFYIYIDIDGNESNGCNVTQYTEVNTTGYDVAIYFNQTAVGSSPELRVCNSTIRGDFDSPGNYNTAAGAVNVKAQETCAQGGPMGIGILHFLFNSSRMKDYGIGTANVNASQTINASQIMKMGFYAKSGNGSGIQDSFTQKLFYTPGSMDFIPFDPAKCASPAYNDTHLECRMFGGQCPGGICFGPGQGFFNNTYFDNCFTPTGPNCGNPSCFFIPECRGQVNDTVAPVVRFTNVVEFADRAFVDWSTNEPSMGNVSFYGNDSNCQNLVKSVGERLPAFMNQALSPPDWEYKPFHHVELDNGNLGSPLNSNTMYYFKTTSKDKANNSAISNCLSFFTNSTQTFGSPKNINMTPPAGINFQFDDGRGGFQSLVSGNYTNKTDQRLKFAPADGSWQIVIPGVDFTSDIGVDLSNAFRVNSTTGMVGMDTNSWLELAQKLTTDSIDVTIPGAGDILRKCNDSGGGCSDVTSMATLISSGGGQTTWRIPVSLGFSTYTVNSSTSGFDMSSDSVIYQAYPIVSAYVNFTNLNSSIIGALLNVTVNASASGAQFTVEYYNGSQWISGTALGTPAKLYEGINVSGILEFRFNISMSTTTTGRWNFSILVSNASEELNRDSPTANARPYLDSINLTSPASGAITIDTMPDFTFTYRTESDSITRNCTLYAGAGIYSLGSTSNGTATNITPGEPLSEGVNTWNVTCIYVGYDIVPLVSQSLTLTIDSLTPGIEYAGGIEVNAYNASRNWIYINVTASDATEQAAVFRLFNSSIEINQTVILGAGNRSHTFTSVPDGLYYYNVTINDSIGNVNFTPTRSIRLDTTPPTVTSFTTNDADSKVKSSDSLNFSATIVDTGSGLSTVVMNGTTLNSAGSGVYWTVNTTAAAGMCPSNGNCIFTITATDVASNANNSETLTLTVDGLYPSIDYAGGTNVTATNISRNWIYINVTITENNPFNVTFYLYNSTGLFYTNVTGSTNKAINYTVIADGLYYYNVTVNDSVAYSNSTSTRSIRLDTSTPSVTITAPYVDQALKGTTATLTATVTDANSVVTVYFNVSNGTSYLGAYNALASGNTWSNATLDTTLLSDGLHNVTIYATDLVGKLNNSEVRNFYVDNTYPTLTLNYPADGVNLTVGNVNFTWMPTDALDTNISCNITLDSVVNQSWVQSNNGSPFNQTVWSIPDGFHTWSVSCWDNATNVNTSSTRSFTVETTAPVLAMTSPSNNSILTDSYFNMTIQVNESNPPATAAFCTYNLSNSSTVVSGSILNSSFSVSGNVHTNITAVGLTSGMTNGTLYNLSINCIDAFSKNVTKVYNLTVLDNTIPSITRGVSYSGTTSVSAYLTANTSEYTACKWSYSNVAYASMTLSLATSDGIVHTQTNSYTDPSADTGTYYVACSDNNGNIGSTSLSYDAAVQTTTTTTTSGGGGSSGSGATSSPIVTRSWSVLGSGTTSFQVLSTAIDVTDLSFRLAKSVTNPAITVSKIEASFMTAPALTNVQVYQLLQITKTNIADADLSNLLIKFKVPKSWLFDKQIGADSIVLKRYTTVWIDLSTTKTKEDAVYVYYEATASGLSYFAISTRQTITPTAPATNVTAPPAEQPPAEQPPAEQPPAEQPPIEAPPAAAKGIPAWQIAVVLIIIIVLGIGAYLFYTQKSEKTQESPPQHVERKHEDKKKK